jgi:hypothetical protein
MKNKLDKLIKSIDQEIKKQDAYPYLPEILEILSLMRTSIVDKKTDKERKSKLIGGLMRLVTEDFEFSESDLGTEILEVANQYYESL